MNCANPECGHGPEQHAYTMIDYRGWCEYPDCPCGWWQRPDPAPVNES